MPEILMYCTNNNQVKLIRWTNALLEEGTHMKPINLSPGHQATINTCEFMNKVNFAATGSSDKLIKIWDIERCLTSHEIRLEAECFTVNFD